MRRVIEPLTRMGGRIDSVDGHAPITVNGAPLHAIAYEPAIPSAQVKSAILLAGLQASGTTSVTEPAQTRDHTERAFAAFGIRSGVDGLTVSVEGGQRAEARARRSRRLFVRGVLDGGGSGAPGIRASSSTRWA